MLYAKERGAKENARWSGSGHFLRDLSANGLRRRVRGLRLHLRGLGGAAARFTGAGTAWSRCHRGLPASEAQWGSARQSPDCRRPDRQRCSRSGPAPGSSKRWGRCRNRLPARGRRRRKDWRATAAAARMDVFIFINSLVSFLPAAQRDGPAAVPR